MELNTSNDLSRKIASLLFYLFMMNFAALFVLYALAHILYPGSHYPIDNIESWPNEVRIHTSIAANFYIYAFLTLFFLTVLWPYYRKEWAIFKHNLSRNVRLGIGFYFVGITAMAVVNAILMALGINMDNSENQEFITQAFRHYPLYVFSFTLMAPLIEETVFRGFIFEFFDRMNLTERTKTILFFVTSIILFGSIHITTELIEHRDVLRALVVGLPYFVIGASICTVYYLTKSLFAAVLTHFIQNFVSSIMMLLLILLESAGIEMVGIFHLLHILSHLRFSFIL